MRGTATRNAKGQTISAVCWVEKPDVWVELTIVNALGEAERITLPRIDAFDFGQELLKLTTSMEVLGVEDN